ncbi:Uncharacterised protein [Mycobacterium tuberculosis]|nr:Uncharacterised protein [Mycobacterium tuberculosis]CPC09073.1 Uncharacterised protein [Mycobacterium tuberculosis]
MGISGAGGGCQNTLNSVIPRLGALMASLAHVLNLVTLAAVTNTF